jgi:hypothetical protein
VACSGVNFTLPLPRLLMQFIRSHFQYWKALIYFRNFTTPIKKARFSVWFCWSNGSAKCCSKLGEMAVIKGFRKTVENSKQRFRKNLSGCQEQRLSHRMDLR